MSYLNELLSTGESVQLVTRQHWVTLVRSILLYGFLVALLVLISGIGAGLPAGFPHVAAAVAAALVIVPLAFLLREVLRWSNRQFIVTTRRVIEVEGVLNKNIGDSNLDKVNDLLLSQSVLGRLLGYGDIEIITGSDVGLNRLDRISRPMLFQRAILDNKEDLDTLARLRDDASVSGPEAATAIERLGALRERGLITAEEFDRKKAELLARL